MSRSETAFKNVARQLERIRGKLSEPDAKVIDNAAALLMGVSDLFHNDTTTEERHAPGTFHVCLIDGDDRDVFVVSKQPLSVDEKVELTRRCTTPLCWPLCDCIKVDSLDRSAMPSTPVYDRHGRFFGTILDVPTSVAMPLAASVKGGIV